MKGCSTRERADASSSRARIERVAVALVCAAVFIAGALWWLGADKRNYQASEWSSNLLTSVTGEPASALLTSNLRAGYAPATNGVCHVEYDGSTALTVQGLGEGKGYRWTAVLPYEEFTITGTYQDADGVTRNCDLATYEEHSAKWEAFDSAHAVRVFPNGGSDLKYSTVWGDGDFTSESLHVFHGTATRLDELEEGDSLGEGAWFLTVSRSDNCDMDPCVDGVAWTYSIQATYEHELLIPSEERLRS